MTTLCCTITAWMVTGASTSMADIANLLHPQTQDPCEVTL